MNIVCLDMEGVLVPEIWIAFAEESGIPELRRTTRDEPDYDKPMRWRIDLAAPAGAEAQRHSGDDLPHRPAARRQGVSGRAAQGHAGGDPQRYL